MLQGVYRIEIGSEEEMSKVMREKDVAKGLLSKRFSLDQMSHSHGLVASKVQFTVITDLRLQHQRLEL